CVMWDGTTTWVLLDGHLDDVEAQSRLADLRRTDGPPPSLPALAPRWSLAPSQLRSLPSDGHGPFLAEIGCGVVHRGRSQPRQALDPVVVELHRRMKAVFDPSGRLAPGRTVLP